MQYHSSRLYIRCKSLWTSSALIGPHTRPVQALSGPSSSRPPVTLQQRSAAKTSKLLPSLAPKRPNHSRMPAVFPLLLVTRSDDRTTCCSSTPCGRQPSTPTSRFNYRLLLPRMQSRKRLLPQLLADRPSHRPLRPAAALRRGHRLSLLYLKNPPKVRPVAARRKRRVRLDASGFSSRD